MHLGDIKNGSSQCTTSYFEQIRADFDGFADPLVYTPGDNEWTDCHRANNGAFWPAGPVLNGDTRPARLDEVHRIFFPAPGWTLGQHARRVEHAGGRVPRERDLDAGRRPVRRRSTCRAPTTTGCLVRTAPDQLAGGRGQQPDRGRPRLAGPDLRRGPRPSTPRRSRSGSRPTCGTRRSRATRASTTTSSRSCRSWRARRFASAARSCCSTATRTSSSTTIRSPIRPGRRTSRSTASPRTCRTCTAITVNGSTTPCHEWLKLTVDPHAAGVFSYQRIRFHKQPGFDHTVCPES